MDDLSGLGKILMVGGAVLFVVGLLVVLGCRIPFIGRLPGDMLIQRKGFGIYVPIATCIVLSVLLTPIPNFISRR